MKISNAYLKTTRNNNKVFRLMLDTNEMLSYLEQGKTIVGIDICTRNGIVKIVSGKSLKTGQQYEAIHYYTWAMEATQKGQANDNKGVADTPIVPENTRSPA